LPDRSRRQQSAATLDDLRRRNLAHLLRIIHQHGAVTRSHLASVMGVNRSTVGALAAELAEVGIVQEGAGVGNGVGRPSLLVEPVATSAAVIAYDLRVERVDAALVGLGGEVLASRHRRLRRGALAPTTAVRTLTALAEDLLASQPGVPVVGAAVAVPGLVQHDDGTVVFAPNLGWADVPLGEMLTAALGRTLPGAPPVEVGNDADFGVAAEHMRGAGEGAANVVFLSGEVGIGGGIVLDGQVMAGGSGFGGEVGHMVVNPVGRRCRCGTVGCWETEIGRPAVLSAVGLEDVIGDVPDLDELIAQDGARRASVERVADWLGIGLANLVNIFNPEVIVLGGHLRVLHQACPDAVDRRLEQALPASRRRVRLAYPAFGRSAALMGAAETAFGPLLDDPLGSIAAASAAS
jgi:predicted NBD/HSP70 family sugar kinase